MADFTSSVLRWFEHRVDQLHEETRQVAEDAVVRGEAITKHHIETRGTAKSGKRGRIETGHMRDSVSHGTVSETENEVVKRFGYKDSPYYTEFQEKGFVSWTGADVEGMYALTDAAEEVLEDFVQGMSQAVRRA